MAAGNRVHYYHADACAFGGYFQRPIEHVIAPQAPMSLPPSGGYGFARAENFRIEGLVSFKSAFTQVSGHLSKKDRGGWVTLVTAVVEGFNALDIVTADRLCAQISTEHPLEGDNPKVTFLGTSFDNLKIAGYPIKVTLDFRICDQGNGDGYPDIIIGGSNAVSVLLQDATAPGTFLAATNYTVQNANEIAIADVNGDGLLDIVIATGPSHPVVDGVISNEPGVLLQSATAPGTFKALQALP